ncbi:MAG TPA: carbohydrate kinase family protein [Candidatus Nanoarchaeia archaeon]|nr:carbohydrate kinase family protein [Candidatus Nanoarchaeia archaeon]
MISNKLDIVIISHASIDITIEGIFLGGPTSYGGRILSELGSNFLVVPQIGRNDFLFRDYYYKKIKKYVFIENKNTTTFRLEECKGLRNIYVVKRAENLNIKNIPKEAFQSKYILLSPIVDDMPIDFVRDVAAKSHNGVVCIDPFNNDNGRFTRKHKHYFEQLLDYVQIIKLSKNELLGLSDCKDMYKALERLGCSKVLFLITLGSQGVLVYNKNMWKIVPPFKKYLVKDTTGCGDIFFASFIYGLVNNFPLLESALFGNICAGLSVREKGVDSIPSKSDIWEEFENRCSYK